ncbi:MAG: ATP-binding protein, partial [bacterium]
MKSAYPIHPELFDRLYQDWSTLDRFQRTRGVLRLMAKVIHELWEREDKSLLIMPGTQPLDNPPVRTEITRYLPEGWAAVIDKDIDGEMSVPLALDRDNPNLGRYSACRRVARTVFIGSAPSVAAQKVRGTEENRVKLGCVQPGESSATFGDALRRLSEKLTYLYSDNSRYWFDTQPTVGRIARDRAAQLKPEVVEDEIIRRLRVIRERSDFAGVHIAPGDSGDVPDEPACRLVVLGPKAPFTKTSDKSPAQTQVHEILDRRGNSPRQYKNMLAFLAPDRERLLELEQAVRDWLAWKSIQQDEIQLNLDKAQSRQVETYLQKAEETVSTRIGETYCHLLIPTQEGTGPIEWTRTRLQGQDSIITRAAKKMRSDGNLVMTWSPLLLRRELDRWLWKEQPHLNVKQLWEYLCKYLYLPRLRDENVLLDAIRQGVNSLTWTDFFAYASGFDEASGRYLGLVTSKFPQITLDSSSVLVKPEVAAKQLDAEAAAQAGHVSYPTGVEKERTVVSDDRTTAVSGGDKTTPKASLPPKRYHGSVQLAPTRLARDVGQIAEEVIQHLTSLVGAQVEITLEITAVVPNGVPENVVRIVTENARTLKFKTQGFEIE